MRGPSQEESIGLLGLDERSPDVELRDERIRSDEENGAFRRTQRQFATAEAGYLPPFAKARWSSNWKTSLIRFAWFLVPSFLQGQQGMDLIRPAKLHPTAYLDGMRGVAAFIVFIYHNAYQSYDSNFSWGANGKYYDLLRLPVIRALWQGTPGVSLFFIISGYALSYRPMKFVRSQNHKDFSTTMSSLVFRRLIRLYAPLTVSTFIIFCLLRINAYEWTRDFSNNKSYMRTHTEHHPERFLHTWNQFKDWAWRIYRGVYVFAWDLGGANSYDPHLWTIPIEYRCSLYLFLTIIGTARLRTTWRYLTVIGVTIFSYRNSRWEFMLFLVGMGMAEWDHIRGAHVPSPNPPILEKQTKPGLEKAKRIGWNIGIFIGLYLMSYPIADAPTTPGYSYLSTFVPEWWEARKSHLWESTGAAFFAVSVAHLGWWQGLFTTTPIQYLGKISYALYLTHGPVMHVICYHIKEWAWIVTGVEGTQFHFGFALGLLCSIPVIIWCADVFWRAVDIPTVKFAKWFENQLIVKSE